MRPMQLVVDMWKLSCIIENLKDLICKGIDWLKMSYIGLDVGSEVTQVML
jgi:hypothetical protein